MKPFMPDTIAFIDKDDIRVHAFNNHRIVGKYMRMSSIQNE